MDYTMLSLEEQLLLVEASLRSHEEMHLHQSLDPVNNKRLLPDTEAGIARLKKARASITKAMQDDQGSKR